MESRIPQIEEMLTTQPDDPFLRYALALEYIKIGKTDQSKVLLIELTTSNPDYLASYYQLGKLEENQGETEEAIFHYQEGKKRALSHGDLKTAGELSEALMMLDIFD
jgi:predicted Zn-dependent protease